MAHIDYDFSTTNANVVAMLFSRPITGTFSAHVDTDDLVIGIGPVVVEKERLDDPVCPECTIAVLVVFKDIDLHIVSDDLGIGLAASSLADSVWALLASKARDWFARDPRRLDRLGATCGTMMVGLGTVMLTQD